MREVYVVTGEFVTSRNGDVAWVVGVAADEETARKMAEADANGFKDEVIYIAGEQWNPQKGYDPDESDRDDWTVWYSWDKHDVVRPLTGPARIRPAITSDHR